MKYYCGKNFETINWGAIQRAMSTCSLSTRIWIAKYSCGFVGTAQVLARREYWLENRCPRCGHHNETYMHVIQCPHPPHREQMLRRLGEFKMWLKARHIDADIIQDIIMITTA